MKLIDYGPWTRIGLSYANEQFDWKIIGTPLFGNRSSIMIPKHLTNDQVMNLAPQNRYAIHTLHGKQIKLETVI